MIHTRTPKPLALAAISALMASTAAPALAQDSTQAQAPATTPAAAPPVAVTPITEAPPPVAATTAPVAPTSAVAQTPAPTAEAVPVAKPVETRRAARSTHQERTVSVKPTPIAAKAATGEATPMPPKIPAKDSSASTTAPAASPSLPETVAQNSVQTSQQASADQSQAPDWTILGVAGGLAALGVAGAGLTFARRRRREGEPAEALTAEAETAQIASMPAAMASAPQPAEMVAARTAPSPEPAPLAPVIGDLGRHERLAEQGPTVDNPFLTRRARVRRARFYDRRERLAAAQAIQPQSVPAQPAQAPVQEAALKTPTTQLTYSFGPNKNPGWIATPVLRKR